MSKDRSPIGIVNQEAADRRKQRRKGHIQIIEEDRRRLKIENDRLTTELDETRSSNYQLTQQHASNVRELAETYWDLGAAKKREDSLNFELGEKNRKLDAAEDDSRRLDHALRWLLDTQSIEMPTDSWESWITKVADLCSRGRNLIGAMEEAQDEINDERAAIDAGKDGE